MKNDVDLAGENLSKAFLQFPYLYRYSRRTHVGPADERFDLKPGDIMMLFAIKNEQNKQAGVTATMLSASTGMKTPSINPILSALEERRLICRATDPGDRRFVLITLTENGEKVLDHVRRRYVSRIRELVAYLGTEKSNLLAELMDEVYEYLRQKGGCPSEDTQK